MDQGKIALQLWPIYGGAYTRLSVAGVIPTAVPSRELQRLLRGLSFWSGYPVQCALSAGGVDLGWYGWWLDQLAVIPGRHLELRCVRGTAEVAGDDH